MRRVVVTGLGMVTPLACGVDQTWKKIINSQSGIDSVKGFDVSDISSKIAGQVPWLSDNLDSSDPSSLFNPNNCLPEKDQRKTDKFVLYALEAARQAIESSNYVLDTQEKQERAGVSIGAGIGGLQWIHDTATTLNAHGAKRVSPFFIPASLINLASGQVSIKFGLKGPNHAVVTACASGTHSIGDAARMIALNDADIMLAGGSESAVCRLGMSGFASSRALSTAYNETPSKASRPWDKDRDGFVIGEGAGVLFLEELEHAKKRGANIYAEVIGYGLSGDAHHITAPSEDGSGAYRSMQAALKRSGLNLHDIAYINAHGTSTPLGDAIELNAVKRLFLNACDNLSMSSTKSATGHLLGAAGAIEAIFSILAMRDGIMPPTLNLDNPSPGCDLDLVPHIAKKKDLPFVMSNSFGFGGTNGSLIFARDVK